MSNSLPRQPAMPAVSHGTLPAKLDGTYTYTHYAYGHNVCNKLVSK